MGQLNRQPEREPLRTAMARIRDNASAHLAARKDHASDGFATVADAARETTRQLREGHHDYLASCVEKVAGQIERFSAHVKERNVSELVDDVRQFARRRPAVFIGSAFVAGLVCSRLLKSPVPDDADAARRRAMFERTGHEWTEKLR